MDMLGTTMESMLDWAFWTLSVGTVMPPFFNVWHVFISFRYLYDAYMVKRAGTSH